jgi:multicomponent Na+:H+ antiporter subunit A
MSPDLAILATLVGLPFLGAALTPVVHRVLGERTAYYAASIAAICLALVTWLFRQMGGESGTVSIAWIPTYDISLLFYVDGLALLIGFLASGIGTLILFYSRGYMHGEPMQAKYYAALLAFMGSMLGVAMAGDLIVLFVFWELTSLSSFILIGHYTGERASRYAARKSVIITVGGGLFMLAGFLLLASTVGTFSIAEILSTPDASRSALHEAGAYLPVLGLVGIGVATKSAQVPLHVWLPDAMEAPTPVSAFLHSATLVKAGVYLVGRFRPLLNGPVDWTLLFATLGLATMTVTAILAVAASDIKELLAYSTASHLGLIVAGFGFASKIGAETGAFHILTHASFKAALFLVAGIIAHEAGTRRLDDLGGLGRELPITAAVTVVAALSMGGIPPFSGFYSKELLFDAAYEFAHQSGGVTWLAPAIAVLGSVFTVLYSIRFLLLFFGEKPDPLGAIHRPPLTMVIPPGLLAVVVAVMSVDPDLAIRTIVGDVALSTGGPASFHVGIPTSLKPPVIMSIISLGTGAILFLRFTTVRNGIRDLLSVDQFRADWYYDQTVHGLTRLSVLATPRLQPGLLRTYAIWIVLATSGLALAGYLAAGVRLPADLLPSLAIPLVLVLLVALVAVVAMAIAPSHIAGVLSLSILGFMVAIFYILVAAPDLALTQLVVETLALVIFLLVLDQVPAFYGAVPRGRQVRDLAVASVVGITVALTVLLSTSGSPTNPIDGFLAERAGIPAEHGRWLLDWGGGGNIVNVILVDFRAFDTMGEIAVVALAGLSVLTLVAMRERGETG